VQVLAIPVRLDHAPVFGDLCHNPQFNLGVIRNNQLAARRGGEAGTELLIPRDLLDIWPPTAHPPAPGADLRIPGMQSAGYRMNLLR
jgi:hypothetical protein